MNDTHNAPPVSYPVGRSRFLGVALWLFWLVGCAASVAAGALGALDGWRGWVLVVGVAVAGGLGLQFWRGVPHGRLRWDGGRWWFQATEPMSVAEIEGLLDVRLDFQQWLLLAFEPVAAAGRRRWLWLDAAHNRPCWHGLRCAVYCTPPRANSDARAEPGAADP